MQTDFFFRFSPTSHDHKYICYAICMRDVFTVKFHLTDKNS